MFPFSTNTAPHPANALPQILVTQFGMVSEVRLVQPENASCPSSVTLFGMVTEVRLEHPLNASSPIAVTLWPLMVEGMVREPAALEAFPIVASPELEREYSH